MDPIVLGITAIVAVTFLVALRVPVAISMLLVAFLGMFISKGSGFALIQLQLVPFALVSSYTFVVIPMFILMGAIVSSAGLVSDLYNCANLWLTRFRGSLYHATVVGSTIFAAISGSTIVNSAMFTKIALPEMIQLRYHKGFAGGCIAGVGTLAALIPPSLSFVIFGILTGESIGKLLIAGIIPGLMTALLFIISISVTLKLNPNWAPKSLNRPTLQKRLTALSKTWPFGLLVLIVLGGIYTGIMPPSAAGAIGVVGAITITILKRSLTRQKFVESVDSTLTMSAAILLILVGGSLFARFLLTCGFIGDINELVNSYTVSALSFLICIIILYLIMGMFVDPISIMVMTLPFLFPLSQSMDIDPIWFGVIVVKLVEIAVITPPVGMNLFAVVTASEGKISSKEVFAGVLPFILAEICSLTLLFCFPTIATFLPNSMN